MRRSQIDGVDRSTLGRTWPQLQPNLFSSVEDPLTNQSIPFEEFAEIYRPLLETFDGRDAESYIDLYFEASRVDSTKLVFIDEDAQLDFRHEAIQMGLIPSVGVIMVGESAEEADLRRQREEEKRYAIEKQRRIKAAKPRETHAQRQKRMIMQAQSTLERLQAELATASQTEQIRIEKKIMNITRLLSEKSNTC